MPLNARPGDILMCKGEQGSSGALGDNRHGPLRVIGVNDKVRWGLREGPPVVVATNKTISANVSDTLAHTILSQGNLVEKERQADPVAQ